MTKWQIAWDLAQIPLGIAAAYVVAIRKGDAIMQRISEKRRLDTWSRLRPQVVGQFQAATGPMFVAAQLRGRLDRTPGFNPDKWVTHLREILSRATARTGDGILGDEDLWNRELDPEVILGATDVGLEFATQISQSLTKVLLLYRESLPDRTQQLLAEAVFATDNARHALRPLGIPEHQKDKRLYDIQATTNTRCMIAMFEALLALLEDVSSAKVESRPRRGL